MDVDALKVNVEKNIANVMPKDLFVENIANASIARIPARGRKIETRGR